MALIEFLGLKQDHDASKGVLLLVLPIYLWRGIEHFDRNFYEVVFFVFRNITVRCTHASALVLDARNKCKTVRANR